MDTSSAWVIDVFLVLFFSLANEKREQEIQLSCRLAQPLRVGLVSINQPLNEEIQSRHSFSLYFQEKTHKFVSEYEVPREPRVVPEGPKLRNLSVQHTILSEFKGIG